MIGTLPQVVAGEWLKASGTWTVDRDHGPQFKATHLETVPPSSKEGIEKFLASGLVKGIGKVYAAKLVERFGCEIFDVIEQRSAQLERIDGIGPLRRQRIKESWQEARTVREIMTFLLGHGVSTARAFRIFKRYGEDAIEKVREDPYRLARDIRGIGFLTADKIAAELGIARDSELRARAGVEHALLELTGKGHCAYPREELITEAADMLDIPTGLVEQAILHGIENRRLVSDTRTWPALIFPAYLHRAETMLARDLNILNSGPHPCPPIDAEKALDWCEKRLQIEFAPAQRHAIKQALVAKVMIITGGPGVGKTTIVHAILDILQAKNMNIVLAAPTGRAAKRMAETTGREAKTLHRLLAYDPGRGRFRNNAENPLEGDVFIIDESSMIDITLAAALVDAIPPHAALIWVGDVDQLPSVGPGTVLKDLIRSNAFCVERLNEVFRQAARSQIVTNAHLIHEGRMPELGEKGSESDFFLWEAAEPEQAVQRILHLVKTAIPTKFGFDPVEDIQVLTPMRRGLLGSQNLNMQLQQQLNPNGDFVERFGHTFRVGDKVMQLENDYDKEVFNGDTGRVTRIDRENREMHVRIDGRKVVYDLNGLDELAPSYAITIHKSQGSEYPCVVIPIHTQHYIMLQRNLLYTAITRGRKLVILVGTKKALGLAIRNNEVQDRISTLQSRFR